jgi:hypothetical protein
VTNTVKGIESSPNKNSIRPTTMDNLFVGIGGGGVDPAQFFRDLPPVSRVLLASTLACTALVNVDILEREDLDFHSWEDVFVGRDRSGRVEAWR